MVGNIKMNFVVGYSFYFVLGYFFNRLERKYYKIIYIIGGVSFFLTIFLSTYFSHKNNNADEMFHGYFTLNVMFEGILIFILVKDLFENCKLKRVQNFIIKLSKYSFGAYLVHVLILELLDLKFDFNTYTLSFHPVLAILAVWIVVAVLSFSISAILNRIPLLKKYIV